MSDTNASNTLPELDCKDRYLILGAGVVGLGLAQTFKDHGIAYDQVDANDEIGGNWYNGVYETTHIISSKNITQFSNFPMPSDYPDFPSARQIFEYICSFADHFKLRERIELNRIVKEILPVENNLWQVTFESGKKRVYKGVMVCNGHHWCKKMPRWPGQFNGEIIHAKDYKAPRQLRGQSVLVVGAGNSGCDIASEAARVGKKCALSMREIPWFIPKSFCGVPSFDLMKWWMPEFVQRIMLHGIIRLTYGKHASFGLKTPRMRLLSTHPTVSEEAPYYLRHGRIQPRPEIKELDGNSVRFTDGRRDEFDLIVCATGYQLAYPFVPQQLNRVVGQHLQCYGGAFLPDYKGLCFLGWQQVRGGIGSLVSAKMPLFIRFLKLQDQIKIPIGQVLKEMGDALPRTHLYDAQMFFRKIWMTNRLFPQIAKKAKALDLKAEAFSNQILASTKANAASPLLWSAPHA